VTPANENHIKTQHPPEQYLHQYSSGGQAGETQPDANSLFIAPGKELFSAANCQLFQAPHCFGGRTL